MNRIKLRLYVLIVVLVITACPIANAFQAHAYTQRNFGATSGEIVMEVLSKRVLYGSNIHEKKYMASTTKILTAITVIENCDISETVTVTKETVGVEGSSIYLEEGERLTVSDLLYGLMLRSGNDCAETLAVYCSGSIESFAELMNKTAKKIGATESNFVNPHGLHDDAHYTTAYDLALISCYAMENPTFKEIVSTKKKVIPFTTRNTSRLLINKNKMLTEFDGANGVKTGFTKKAGRCLVSGSLRHGMQLICVVLNCPPMFERSKTLLSNAFNEYSVTKLIESDEIIDFIKSKNGKSYGVHILKDVVVPLTEKEKDCVTIEYVLPEILAADVKSGDEIGEIKIYCENNLIFTEKVFTI